MTTIGQIQRRKVKERKMNLYYSEKVIIDGKKKYQPMIRFHGKEIPAGTPVSTATEAYRLAQKFFEEASAKQDKTLEGDDHVITEGPAAGYTTDDFNTEEANDAGIQ